MLFTFRERNFVLEKRALIVGILNITPDSFSDGGAFLEPNKAYQQALKLLHEGADIIDIGGTSTRPGKDVFFTDQKSALSGNLGNEEIELQRVIPVIKALRKTTDVPISIDTTKAAVAEAALAAGADIINDVSAFSGDPRMGEVVARTKAGLMLMHMQGTPETMQQAPSYPNDDVVSAISNFFIKKRQEALDYGIKAPSIILDPGIGFGKTFPHNLTLIRCLPELVKLGSPMMIGHSRKAFLSYINEPEREPTNRFAGGIAITSLARQAGAMLFRVHDVRPHWEALRTTEAMLYA